MTKAQPDYYVGLMSGTSLDGIDAVLADFSRPTPLLHSFYSAYPDALCERLLALHTSGHDELHQAAVLGIELSRAYAHVIAELLQASGIQAEQVTAVGCHGQTVRHRPDCGYTIQLVNGALLAELAGIAVVCDFRSRDLAAGGQGAPLVPAFHQAAFHDDRRYRVIVNIGGIANLSGLPPAGDVIGFDCGPGNMLMDAWIQLRRGDRFDAGGAWAESGKVIPGLLQKLLAHDYFKLAPPKSSGREAFNLGWLAQHLTGKEAPADVQATLLMLTVETVASAIRGGCPGAAEIYLCGGGARNHALVARLRTALPGIPVGLTDDLGINADWLEALAFAWLAQRTVAGQPGNLPAVTGARGSRVLGAIYPA